MLIFLKLEKVFKLFSLYKVLMKNEVKNFKNNKLMKKTLIVMLCALFTMSLTTYAQKGEQRSKQETKKEIRQASPKRLTAEERANYWAKELNLSDEEKAKVTELFKKEDENRAKYRQEMQKNREEMRAQMQNDRKANDAELEKIIGKEKFQKYDSIRSERMKNRRRTSPTKGK